MAKKVAKSEPNHPEVGKPKANHDSRAPSAFSSSTSLAEDPAAYCTRTVRFIDLFCGIGGFHVAIKQVAKDRGIKVSAVFASDIDGECQSSYEANFSLPVHG